MISRFPKLTPSLRTNAFKPSPTNTSMRTEKPISVATSMAGRPNRREGMISTRKDFGKNVKMLEASKTELWLYQRPKLHQCMCRSEGYRDGDQNLPKLQRAKVVLKKFEEKEKEKRRRDKTAFLIVGGI